MGPQAQALQQGALSAGQVCKTNTHLICRLANPPLHSYLRHLAFGITKCCVFQLPVRGVWWPGLQGSLHWSRHSGQLGLCAASGENMSSFKMCVLEIKPTFIYILMHVKPIHLCSSTAYLQSWGAVLPDLPLPSSDRPHHQVWTHLLLAVHAALPLYWWQELVQVPHLLWGSKHRWPEEVSQ